MGKHELPRRARLLPLLGVLALVVGLLAVGRFAMADPKQAATDLTAPATDAAPSTTPAADPTTEATDDADKAKQRKKERKKQKKRSRQLRKKVQIAADGLEPDDAVFRIGSFNILGHGHTTKSGNKPGYADSSARMGWTVDLIRQNEIDVIGLQEYEPKQHHRFLALTGGDWGVYPGLEIGNKGVRNSIAWNKAVWELVEAHTFQIPYFHGNLVPKPYIKLQHKETGRYAWFINIHNPASTRGPAQKWRNEATRREIAIMNELQAPDGDHEIGTPTFLVGDFNERKEAFCMVTSGANAQAANGGTASPCSPPGNHGIDWIFGSTPGVTFADYVRSDGGLVNRASDHPLLYADVTLTGDAPAADD